LVDSPDTAIVHPNMYSEIPRYVRVGVYTSIYKNKKRRYMDIIYSLFVTHMIICALISVAFGCLVIMRRRNKITIEKVENMPGANLVITFHMIVGGFIASIVFTCMIGFMYRALISGAS